MDDSQPLSSTKIMTLPFRLVVTPAARRRVKLYLTIGVAGVAGIAGGLAWAIAYLLLKGPLTATMIATIIVLLVTGYSLDWIARWKKGDLPRGSVEISADRIRCRDLVAGDCPWGDLTIFRWVLQRSKGNATLVERSDGRRPDRAIPARYFVVEAADLKETAETNAYGYYDRAAIQFDLDDLCLTPPARKDADAVLAMLNRLQAAAGTLRDGDAIEVPALLNAIPVTRPAPARSTLEAAIVQS